MPPPTTRIELVESVTTSYDKLRAELLACGESIADEPCTADWTVADLLEVRIWWTRAVVNWIRVGRRGETPTTPAPGYTWRETPRLNDDVIAKAKVRSLRAQRAALARGVQKVLATIDVLDDRELFEVGAYAWAGKWPLSRWVAINTVRQYATARTMVRRAVRSRSVQ